MKLFDLLRLILPHWLYTGTSTLVLLFHNCIYNKLMNFSESRLKECFENTNIPQRASPPMPFLCKIYWTIWMVWDTGGGRTQHRYGTTAGWFSFICTKKEKSSLKIIARQTAKRGKRVNRSRKPSLPMGLNLACY